MLKYIILLILIVGCSFDDKTGIWTGENKTVKNNNQNENLKPVFKKQKSYQKEVNLEKDKIFYFDNKRKFKLESKVFK